MSRIAVTAASGQLGSEVIKAAVEIVGKDKVIGLARTPGKAESLDVEIRPGDYASRSNLERSLQGMVNATARNYYLTVARELREE